MMHRFGLLRRGALLGVLGCLAAVGLAIPTTAAAKVTSLTHCQLQILSPGQYRLDANIATEHACFVLDASGITLDLNGHTITNRSVDEHVGIMAFKAGDKIVGPGTIAGFRYGISLVNNNERVHGVTAIANGIGIGVNSHGNIVRDNVTTNNALAGIDVFPSETGNTIKRNFAHSNGTYDDLRDNTPNCGNNVWTDNDFGTANQSCIH